MTTKRLPKIRYVSPEQIRIGDVIRVTWKEHDATISAVGVMGKRDVRPEGTYFSTPSNFALFFRDNLGQALALMGLDPKAHVKITLLDSADAKLNQALIPMEEMNNE